MLFTARNFFTTCAPKVYPAPRGDNENSSLSGSGSDHTRSAIGPSWGISRKRSIILIWSIEWMEGDRPNHCVNITRYDDMPTIPRLTSMYTEYLIVNHNTQCQIVEHVGKVVPDIGIAIFPGTLGIEAIGLGNTARLVVPADQMHSVWVSQFQTDKERDGLDAEHAAVDVVA